jgi:hypothetical protein
MEMNPEKTPVNPDAKPSVPSPSFSAGRRWKIALDVLLRTALVVAVVIMANYLSSIFSRQFFFSSQTRVQLSPHTVDILHSLTNHVDVTVYYDKDDGMFTTVMALLNEYHRQDPRINVEVVDYKHDPGKAAQIKEKYHLPSQINNPNGPPEKNLVIFDCNGNYKPVPASALVQLGADGMSKDKKIEFRPVAFKGEMMFTATLQAITNPKPFTAYYLMGHNEPSPGDTGDDGYLKFDSILQQNYIRLKPLSLLGNSDIPSDCNLLIIAGPQTLLSELELGKIDHYLSQGGRALIMLDYHTANRQTGLEDLLATRGVNVGADIVQDLDNTVNGQDVILRSFSAHPAVNSLSESALQVMLPRPIGIISPQNTSANAPTVTPLAAAGPNATLLQHRGVPPHAYPVMVAVEQNPPKGIANANGSMRMIVVGDTMFLGNHLIEAGANRDFAGYAVNWLLDRPMLLNGIGPRPVVEFRLLMTPAQVLTTRWLLLAALPGGILAFGGLVWLRRRK